jgi:hypothetical protein
LYRGAFVVFLFKPSFVLSDCCVRWTGQVHHGHLASCDGGMMVSRHKVAVNDGFGRVCRMQHVAELRAEEDSDACWYVLPDPDDDTVDYFNFVVEIEGPVRVVNDVV